ncbi:hypothetical protein HHI36_014025 [Cryptolaemus montrouzieri]|uniref:Uncharacterized protein n=1 Tax=Cryptolaemus montrouzieri TaxID=559131 RepID=A0ABD2N2K5_9CUCU
MRMPMNCFISPKQFALLASVFFVSKKQLILLYIQTTSILKCSTRNENLIHYLCSRMYEQARITNGRGPFLDLFMEQIFLCGSEGYVEFLNSIWLQIILNNQLAIGCFPLFGKKYAVNVTSSTSNECYEHATGLAIAVMALHIHYTSTSRFMKL